VAVVVERYPHRTGEHCASTALRNLMAFHGVELSEGMVFGLASGLGFYYFQSEEMSPTRMFHGRTATLENDFGTNCGIDFAERAEPDDARAETLLRERLEAGQPVLLSTDTYYLGYQQTTSHFPGHRCVAVGYDDETASVLIADRKYEEPQRCSFDELRRSRNSPDYPIRCGNVWGDFGEKVALGRPLAEAIVVALDRNARAMLEPTGDLPGGIPAMRALAEDLPSWADATDWSWAARFGYQIIRKRGAAESFFRSLYVDFLRESAPHVPALADAGLVPRMEAIVERWRALAAPLKAQSEREACEPALFEDAARQTAELADLEEAFFADALDAIRDVR
jgi:hypothetical protein